MPRRLRPYPEDIQPDLATNILVAGAGGFIGGHLVKRLKKEGFWVRGVDLKHNQFSKSPADEFIIGDLRDPAVASAAMQGIQVVYQLAADTGGAGHIFARKQETAIMRNSATINFNVLEAARKAHVEKLFFASSASVYPDSGYFDPGNPMCTEESAYPADPDSDHGWEKLFSERLHLAYMRNHRLDVRIARLHNIFGPEGPWFDGRENAPAAICRKVREAKDGGEIEIWGDGKQTRSFLYIDECIEAIRRFMNSDFPGPLNIGSEEAITIDSLAEMIIEISGKKLSIRHVNGPVGVRGRCSDNRLIRRKLGWAPAPALRPGLEKTYAWIAEQYPSLMLQCLL